MQVSEPITRRRQQIQTIFQNSNNYKQHSHIYINHIKAQNNKVAIDTSMVIKRILTTPHYNPFSKLLTLRFIRECLITCSYAFLTLLNSQLCSILFDVALFKKSSTDPERGKDLFLYYQGKQFEQEYLKTIGFSFHKIILETFMNVGKQLQKCPYHKQPCLHSNMHRSYRSLLNLHVKFPQQCIYYHKNDKNRFQASYLQKLRNSENIHNFYDYLIGKLETSQEAQTLSIIENIIRSGDGFCIQAITKKIKILIQEEGVKNNNLTLNYIQLTNRLINIGDIQTILVIQKQLLKPILQAYLYQKLASEHAFQICSWGYLLQNVDGFPQNFGFIYKKVSQMLNECEKQKLLPAKKQFYYHCQLLKKQNQAKAKFLDLANPNQQSIFLILKEIISKGIKGSSKLEPSLKIIVQKQEEVFQSIKLQSFYEEMSEQGSVFKKLNSQQSYIINTDSFPQTPPKKRYTRSHKMQQSKTLKEKKTHEKAPLFLQSLKVDNKMSMDKYFMEAKVLSTMRKKRVSKKGDNGSCPNFSEHRSEKSTEKCRKQMSQFDDYQLKLSFLKDQIIKKDMEQEKLKQIIKDKNQQIEKLKINKSFSQKTEEKINSQEQMQSFNSQSFPDKKKQSEEDINSFKNFNFPSTKAKGQILKKKVLIMKNSDIQIGTIISCKEGQVNCAIYITPLIHLYNIQTRVRCPEWVQHRIEQENSLKKQVKAESQYIIVCGFSLKDNLKNIYSLPQTTVTYRKAQSDVFTSIKSFLPIFITRFCQQKKSSEERIVRHMKKGHILTEKIRIQSKFLKNYEHFHKYFPQSLYIKGQNIYGAQFQYEKRELFMTVQMTESKKAILNIIGHKKQELLLKAFVSLLGA